MIFALTQNQEMKLDYNSTLKKYNDETFYLALLHVQT